MPGIPAGLRCLPADQDGNGGIHQQLVDGASEHDFQKGIKTIASHDYKIAGAVISAARRMPSAFGPASIK